MPYSYPDSGSCDRAFHFHQPGAAHLTGTSLPFIAPICISTIQLGATVDYAILMTRGAIISFRNKNAETFNTGKEEKIYVPFAVMTGMILSPETIMAWTAV